MSSTVAIGLILGVARFLDIIIWIIIINALLSWVLDFRHPIRRFLMSFTEPIISPFRRLTERIPTGGLPIDISPLIAIIVIRIIISILYGIARSI